MKTLTVVPPALLVTMFGVPECVRLPAKIGDETIFEAHGIRWHVKRVSRQTCFLSAPLSTGRTRWGTQAEIAEDIGHVLETGAMPISKNRMC